MPEPIYTFNKELWLKVFRETYEAEPSFGIIEFARWIQFKKLLNMGPYSE